MTLRVSRRWEAVGGPAGASEPNDEAEGRGRGAWHVIAGCTLAAALAIGLIGIFFARPVPLSTPLVLPVAMALALLMCARAGRDAPPGVDLAAIFATGVGLRFIGMFFRYRDAVDARVYQRVGEDLAVSFRRFDFDVDPERSVPGTGTVRLFAGALNALLFDDAYAVFCAAAMLSIGAMFLFHRAFRIAVPSADVKRYALLIALWPALWYWPNSLGKESIVLLGLGLASLGAARLLTHRFALGTGQLAAGLVIAALVRPHVALIVGVGLTMAAVLRSKGTDGKARIAGRVAIAAVALTAGTVLSSITAEHFDVDNLGTSAVGATLDDASRQTMQGGSGFDPIRVTTPAHLAPALGTVLFRPFPFEARSLESLVSSAEGMLLALLIAVSLPRLAAAVRVARAEPYLIYAATFVVVFTYAFSAIANFGILARQRTQLLPFLLCLLAVTAGSRTLRAASDRKQRSLRHATGSDGPPAELPSVHVGDTAPRPADSPAARRRSSLGPRRRAASPSADEARSRGPRARHTPPPPPR